jgi:hypothetical protein
LTYHAEISRRVVADRIIAAIRIANLRKAVKSHALWKQLFRGFREDSLQPSNFQRAAPLFAANNALLASLCQTYFDQLGVPRKLSLKQGFAWAAEKVGLTEDLHDLCVWLSQIELSEIPKDAVAPSIPLPDEPSTNKLLITSAETIQTPSEIPHGIVSGQFSQDPYLSAKQGAKADEAKNGDLRASPVETLPVNQMLADSESANAPSEMPLCLRLQVPLDWEPPPDHISQAQDCVTLFERALAAFTKRQLCALHGETWLEKACQSYLKRWRARAARDAATPTHTDLGQATLGELGDVIGGEQNWPAFAPYFLDKAAFQKSMTVLGIYTLRNSSDHGAEREVWFSQHYSAFSAMVDVARAFHAPTAEYIDRVFRETILEPSPPETTNDIAASRILTNLADFSAPELIGRDRELQIIREFWNARYRRVLSIVGKGGVGKTSLLDAFTDGLLSCPCPTDREPDPQMIVYLTAKENYRQGMRRAPSVQRFQTLQRVVEVTLGLLDDPILPTDTVEATITKVQQLAEDNRILFCLDNLEALDNIEHRQIEQFLHDLPAPSKAIVTTRVDRSLGTAVKLEGLAPDAAKRLLFQRLSEHQLEPSVPDLEAVDDLISYTGGSPLAIIAVASKVISGGESITEAIQSFKGKVGLELFEFAYESSVSLLSQSALQALFFLATSKSARKRKDVMPFVADEQELDTVLQTLVDMSLVQYVREESARTLFSVNGDVRDYVLKRAPELLPADRIALVRGLANVPPEQLQSASVRIEVNKAIQEAERLAMYQEWNMAIYTIEQACARWGDEPRLLEKLGYYHYRLRNRAKARIYLETAIAKGYESAECYAHLALLEYYDGFFDRGLGRAESALTLRPTYPFADQVAGECLVKHVFSSRLTLSTDARTKLLQRAIIHLKRSIIAEAGRVSETEFTRRSQQFIERADRLLHEIELEARVSLRVT